MIKMCCDEELEEFEESQDQKQSYKITNKAMTQIVILILFVAICVFMALRG